MQLVKKQGMQEASDVSQSTSGDSPKVNVDDGGKDIPLTPSIVFDPSNSDSGDNYILNTLGGDAFSWQHKAGKDPAISPAEAKANFRNYVQLFLDGAPAGSSAKVTIGGGKGTQVEYTKGPKLGWECYGQFALAGSVLILAFVLGLRRRISK